MVSVLASRVVDRGFESQSGQTNDYKICICCFPAKQAAIMSKSSYILVGSESALCLRVERHVCPFCTIPTRLIGSLNTSQLKCLYMCKRRTQMRHTCVKCTLQQKHKLTWESQ